MPEPARPSALDAERQRRRHPAERRTSRWSGLLVLVLIAQAGFGYSLLGPGIGQRWVVDWHVLLGLLVLLLALLAVRAAHRIPWRARREYALLALGWTTTLLLLFQLGLGLAWHFALVARNGTLLHVGLGLAAALLSILFHTTAILPSILLSARREHAAARGGPPSG